MSAHLDSEIQNDPNTAQNCLLLPGIIQYGSSMKESEINMHCDLKEDIQKVASHKKEGVTMQKIATTVKHWVNSTLTKLGQCMAALEGNDCIEMVEHTEETEVESASCDEKSNITTSTADN